jgi:nitrate/TMAO reductase-like tetraheme cytochrome c subunit
MQKRLFSLACAAVLAVSTVGLAHAERGYAVAPLAKHQQECSSCHVAYPPGLLPAASWQRIMGGLNKHFGTDASLDAASTQEIAAWLQANAGNDRRAREEPPQDRISKANWFVRQHDEVSAATWKRASIGSAANCAACHADAAKGDFNEHKVRIPK